MMCDLEGVEIACRKESIYNIQILSKRHQCLVKQRHKKQSYDLRGLISQIWHEYPKLAKTIATK